MILFDNIFTVILVNEVIMFNGKHHVQAKSNQVQIILLHLVVLFIEPFEEKLYYSALLLL